MSGLSSDPTHMGVFAHLLSEGELQETCFLAVRELVFTCLQMFASVLVKND